MITIGSVSEAKRGQHDNVFAIVRSWKRQSDWIVQMSALSPSEDLFFKYLQMATNGMWDEANFKTVYVPRFLQDMHSDEARQALNMLYQADKHGVDIMLCCFCRDEHLCHRSIIAGLLQGAGANVNLASGADYSDYWEQYKKI